MRVIAGTARSLPLKSPAGQDTRPTTDRIKETLFNMLQSDVPGSVFLDLYAGSGGIGIEALSRGAKKAYFIEHAPAAVSCIQQNIAFTKFTESAIVLKQDAVAGLSSVREKHADIVFMDPPYGEGQDRRVLQALLQMPYIDGETLIIVEEKRDTDFSYAEELGYTVLREKNYKTNKHVFLLRKAQS